MPRVWGGHAATTAGLPPYGGGDEDWRRAGRRRASARAPGNGRRGRDGAPQGARRPHDGGGGGRCGDRAAVHGGGAMGARGFARGGRPKAAPSAAAAGHPLLPPLPSALPLPPRGGQPSSAWVAPRCRRSVGQAGSTAAARAAAKGGCARAGGGGCTRVPRRWPPQGSRRSANGGCGAPVRRGSGKTSRREGGGGVWVVFVVVVVGGGCHALGTACGVPGREVCLWCRPPTTDGYRISPTLAGPEVCIGATPPRDGGWQRRPLSPSTPAAAAAPPTTHSPSLVCITHGQWWGEPRQPRPPIGQAAFPLLTPFVWPRRRGPCARAHARPSRCGPVAGGRKAMRARRRVPNGRPTAADAVPPYGPTLPDCWTWGCRAVLGGEAIPPRAGVPSGGAPWQPPRPPPREGPASNGGRACRGAAAGAAASSEGFWGFLWMGGCAPPAVVVSARRGGAPVPRLWLQRGDQQTKVSVDGGRPRAGSVGRRGHGPLADGGHLLSRFSQYGAGLVQASVRSLASHVEQSLSSPIHARQRWFVRACTVVYARLYSTTYCTKTASTKY